MHLSSTISPATTLLGPSASMPMATTVSPEQLCQIAGAVANILAPPSENSLVTSALQELLLAPPSENSLVTSALLATTTEGSEGTVHSCMLVTVILLIIHIYIGVYR